MANFIIQSTKRIFNNQRGITLIELIAVILIIGIIAAVGVPVVFNQIKGANDAAVAANVDVLNGAIERYALLENGYPVITPSTETVEATKNTANVESLIGVLKGGAKGGPYIKDSFTMPENTDYTKVSVRFSTATGETNQVLEVLFNN